MWITSPLSWPIAKVLDAFMGEHTVFRFDNDQLKYLIMLHSKQAIEDLQHGPDGENIGIDNNQIRAMEGLLTMQDACVEDMMTPFEKINLILSLDTILDLDKILQIRSGGFSRVPVSLD